VNDLFSLLPASAMATNPSHPPRRHHVHPQSWPQSRSSSSAMGTDVTSSVGARGWMGRGRRSSPAPAMDASPPWRPRPTRHQSEKPTRRCPFLSSSSELAVTHPPVLLKLTPLLCPTHAKVKGPWCRLEGVNRRDGRFKLFVPENLSWQCPPVRPVVVIGQALDFTGDTGQTGASHQSDRCSTEHLQKQLQAPLDF
jgi:hypothetical protein